MEWFAQRFTHDRHAGGVRDTTEVRSQVRTIGTRPPMRIGSKFSQGSH